MDEKPIDFSEYLNIQEIDSNINFWLIRTKKGIFYDEYVSDGFVALGWNIIDYNAIKDIGDNEDKEKELKERIEAKYKGKNQGTKIYNKCVRFIKEIKNGDIIMIPSSKNEEIAFAIAEEYYEESSMDYNKEVEIIKRIDDHNDYGIDIKCPYKKRRKIKIIKCIDGERLNPNLYKVLASYHGISKINDYSEFILSSIYNLYIWKDRLSLVFNVEKKGRLDAKSTSLFIYETSKLLTAGDDDIDIATKINLNSPGDILLNIFKYGESIFSFLKDKGCWIILIWFAISGGKIMGIEFNSLLEMILKFREQNSKLQDDALNREEKKLDIENKKLDLEKKKSEKDLEKIESGLSKEEIIKCYEKISATSDKLKINSEVADNIINFLDYRDDENN